MALSISGWEVFTRIGTPQGSILGPAHFLLCINDLPDDVICNIADDTYANDTTLYRKFDQASDLWQQVELVSELESDLQDTGLGHEVVYLFQCLKMNGFVLEVKLSVKMLG